MKKVLFATTALVLTAGVASAEVALSGDARMGIAYNGDDANFTSRARVKFTASGETDTGLTFGFSFRAHESGDVLGSVGLASTLTGGAYGGGRSGAEEGAAGSVFIAGPFGTVSLGDVLGAAEAAVGDLSGVGLTGLGDFTDGNFLTGDGVEVGSRNPVLLYSFTLNDLSLFASLSDGKAGGGIATDGSGSQDVPQSYSVGGNYKFGNYTIAVAYENRDNNGAFIDTPDANGFFNGVRDPNEANLIDSSSQYVIGGTAAFGAATVKAVYGDNDDLNFKWYGASVDYTVGATTITGFAKEFDFDVVDFTRYGIGASYDLGGGAALKGGIVGGDDDGANGNFDTIADFGVAFSF